MTRFLFGPVPGETFADRFLKTPVAAGRWATFDAACPSWDAAVGGLETAPGVLLVWPGYTSVPRWVWSAPVPVVALAHDPNLLAHGYRHTLPLADVVLTDGPSADRLRRGGLGQARAANLFGLDRHFLAGLDAVEGERDVDVAFVGNVNPAVQGGRGRWLGRLAALAERYRVVIAANVFGAEYRTLLRRSRLAFNRSLRGECNLRALEAAASGAVLLQEADNAEVPLYLAPGTEYAPYAEDDFEEVVAKLLADEPRRRGIAERARQRVRSYSFEALVESALDDGGPEWAGVVERAARRVASPPTPSLAGRVWQRASLAGADADPTLAADLEAAGDRHALATLAADAPGAGSHLAAAAAGNRVSAAGLAAALVTLGRRDEAVVVLRTVVAGLDADPTLSQAERESVPYPVRFDHLRVGWERAAYDHPGDPTAEGAAKVALLRGRVAAALAELTGEPAAYRLAADAGPHIPAARAALGCALARAGHLTEGIEYLRFAVENDPFDAPAARALEAALAAAGDAAGVAELRRSRELLARAAPGLAPAPEPAPVTAPTPAPPRTRFVDLPPAEFAARFGRPDFSRALSGFTPPRDTAAVLALVTHFRPRRVLEVGTAAGHMTANLTAFTPPDAVVYSLGVVAEGGSRSGTSAQDYEVPRRDQFAKFVNHFGTAHKAMLVTTDSRTYDFGRLAPLDFVFVDGGHDYHTARSDSVNAYHALRRGGCLVWHDLPSPTPWVEVERVVTDLAFREPVYKVAGTGVAFLVKGEGEGATAGPGSERVAVRWEGEFEAVHSLAGVNRSVCAELLTRGHDVALVPTPNATGAATLPLPPELAARVGRELPGAVTVRHRWPPDFTPPAGGGPFVVVQPWEFGQVPRAWVGPILAAVDEVWVPSRSVLRAFVSSGVPEDRLAVVPNGADPELFRPGLCPLPLPTAKGVKLLFVGGTIPRKGFDVLLAAYRRAFTAADDVALVVKEMGAGTFYRGQTAEKMIAEHRADPAAPEVVFLTEDLGGRDLARLYAACDALVHPYRGEGFGLPVLEAMASARPVVVTSGGPTDEFVPPSAGWRVPARLAYFAEEKVGDLATAGRPWWLEPDPDALAAALREVVRDAAGRERRGAAARRAALGWTWARTAAAVEDRVRVLRGRTPVRFRRKGVPIPATPAARSPAPAPQSLPPAGEAWTVLSHDLYVTATLPPPLTLPAPVPAVAKGRPRTSLTMIVRNEEHNLPDCLASVEGLFDEVVVVDTGSADRTREVARSFGCVVGEFPWVDHFAAARNAALDRATGDYAFWMDADDRLDGENRGRLRTLLANLTGGNDAYVVKCLCVPERPGAGGTVVDHVRLFRRVPQHRWTFRVHEQILPSLRATRADVRWSGVTVRHVGYVDAAVRRRKLDRDLRLLRLDQAEDPGNPFTLFNLGSVYSELGDHRAAVGVLEKSLAASHPRDSIVRKLYALLAQCRAKAGDPRGAAGALSEGRVHYPDDAELLFLAANLARERKHFPEAEELYRRLVDGREADHFASVDAGLRAVKGRHNLAVMLLDQGRLSEAEGLWRAALVADPHFLPARTGLGEAYLAAGNAAGVEAEVAALRELGPEGAAEAAVLDARRLGKAGDHAAAAAVLEEAAREFPHAVGVRVALSHARLAADAPPEVLEAAFKGVLELDPANAQARHNLEVLYRKTGRWVEGVIYSNEPPGGAA
jgi:glycosyltransferase involved in cell wall biosynthesis